MWAIKWRFVCLFLLVVVLLVTCSQPMAVGRFASGDSYGGEGCHYVPAGGAYKFVWIFLHGLGDTCDGWRSAFEEFVRREPQIAENFKIILPTAAVRPITLNRGWPMPGWFDLETLDQTGAEDKKGVMESGNRVQKMIDGEVNGHHSIPGRRILVGGFSQGAAVSYYVGLRGLEPIGAITALSGWMPMRDELGPKLNDTAATDRPAIIHCHGTADDMVKFEFGSQTAELLKSKGYDISFKAYPNMSHSTCATELADLLEFVLSRVSSV